MLLIAIAVTDKAMTSVQTLFKLYKMYYLNCLQTSVNLFKLNIK